jgi:hypothetical protein
VWHWLNSVKLSGNDSPSGAHNGTITGATATVGEVNGAANFPGGPASYITMADSTVCNVPAISVATSGKLSSGGIHQILDRDNLSNRQFQFRINGGRVELIPFINGVPMILTGIRN